MSEIKELIHIEVPNEEVKDLVAKYIKENMDQIMEELMQIAVKSGVGVRDYAARLALKGIVFEDKYNLERLPGGWRVKGHDYVPYAYLVIRLVNEIGQEISYTARVHDESFYSITKETVEKYKAILSYLKVKYLEAENKILRQRVDALEKQLEELRQELKQCSEKEEKEEEEEEDEDP